RLLGAGRERGAATDDGAVLVRHPGEFVKLPNLPARGGIAYDHEFPRLRVRAGGRHVGGFEYSLDGRGIERTIRKSPDGGHRGGNFEEVHSGSWMQARAVARGEGSGSGSRLPTRSRLHGKVLPIRLLFRSRGLTSLDRSRRSPTSARS